MTDHSDVGSNRGAPADHAAAWERSGLVSRDGVLLQQPVSATSPVAGPSSAPYSYIPFYYPAAFYSAFSHIFAWQLLPHSIRDHPHSCFQGAASQGAAGSRP